MPILIAADIFGKIKCIPTFLVGLPLPMVVSMPLFTLALIPGPICVSWPLSVAMFE